MVSSKTLKAENLIASLPQNEGYLIAYSGGADSTALLHIFATLKNVRAIHINHGIQKQALSWQLHCQQTCDRLNIPLIVEQANLADASENSCRIARYDFFEKHLKTNEILLTAHHAEDQAETVLLKLMRGTGIKGLCGMEKCRHFSQGFIARPLLELSKLNLKEYLINNHLEWIEDNSNSDNRYKRNFIRNEIIPNLQNNFTHVIENISRSAANSSQSLDLLNHLVDFKNNWLPINKLKELPQSLQSTLVYHWLSHKNLPTPDKAVLKQITHDFVYAKADKHPHYQNKYYQIYRWQGAIYCIRNFEPINSDLEFQWATEKPFEFPNGCGTLEYKGKKPLNLVIRFNQTGHKLKTHKHQFSKTIKQLFQENKVPSWERQNAPFIYHNNELISLGYDWSHDSNLILSIEFRKGKYQI
jgi:tRNA(Ile)-lysidine synthase